MANRLSKEKANLIASHYCTNGFKKVQALLDSGYSTTYANNVGLKLFDNDLVRQAIARIQAQNKASGAMTVEKVQEMYLKAYELAEETKQSSSMVSAVTGIARLYGMDKDASLDQEQASAMDKAIKEAISQEASKDLYEAQKPRLVKGA